MTDNEKYAYAVVLKMLATTASMTSLLPTPFARKLQPLLSYSVRSICVKYVYSVRSICVKYVFSVRSMCVKNVYSVRSMCVK